MFLRCFFFGGRKKLENKFYNLFFGDNRGCLDEGGEAYRERIEELELMGKFRKFCGGVDR